MTSLRDPESSPADLGTLEVCVFVGVGNARTATEESQDASPS